jgi:predicted transcriptional regulator
MESDYESDQSNYDDYLHNLKKKLKEIHGIARKNLKQAAVYQKRHYDLKAKKRLFKKGQPSADLYVVQLILHKSCFP